MRATWDETWMRVADAMARRSQCDLSQVGAVIVTTDQRVNSSGYNGPMSGTDLRGTCRDWCPRAIAAENDPNVRSDQDPTSCLAVHAEANAVARADFSAIHGGTVYVSGAMCVNCVKLVGNSGLARIVHRVHDNELHRDPDRSEDLARRGGLTVVRWVDSEVNVT